MAVNEQNTKTEEQQEQISDVQNINRRKKIVKIIIIACAAVFVLSGLFAILKPETWFQQQLPPIPVDENIQLYEPDWELNIMTDNDYRQLDHRVHFYDANSGATYSLEEEDLATTEPEILFFYYYFESVRMGNAEAYAEFFAQDYDGTYAIPEEFTMQMVYDIYIEPYRTESETEKAYKVFYKIARNNGTFRADIGEIGGVDVGCNLMFVLRPAEDGFLITHISRFTRH